jgi:hypothetical protein
MLAYLDPNLDVLQVVVLCLPMVCRLVLGIRPVLGIHPVLGIRPVLGIHPVLGIRPVLGIHPVLGSRPVLGQDQDRVVQLQADMPQALGARHAESVVGLLEVSIQIAFAN